MKNTGMLKLANWYWSFKDFKDIYIDGVVSNKASMLCGYLEENMLITSPTNGFFFLFVCVCVNGAARGNTVLAELDFEDFFTMTRIMYLSYSLGPNGG